MAKKEKKIYMLVHKTLKEIGWSDKKNHMTKKHPPTTVKWMMRLAIRS